MPRQEQIIEDEAKRHIAAKMGFINPVRQGDKYYQYPPASDIPFEVHVSNEKRGNARVVNIHPHFRGFAAAERETIAKQICAAVGSDTIEVRLKEGRKAAKFIQLALRVHS